jgi:hypothetical protein
MLKNITAWTESGLPTVGCVRFVSINRQPGGSVSVSVRSNDATQVEVEIPAVEWFMMVRDMAVEHLADPAAARP